MSALVKYEAARQALIEAKSVDEVKDIRDKAEAMRLYAKQAKNIEMETHCAEIKLRATRRIGEISKTLEKSPQAHGGRHPTAGTPTKTQTLKSAGLSTSAANRYEKIADIPETAFESFLAEKQKKQQPAHADDAVKAVQNAEKIKKAEQENGPWRTDAVSDLAALANSGEQFGAIYADPPWSFKVYSGKGKSRSAENHYDTMNQAGIEALAEHVEKLAMKNCALFLWAVMPQLPEALKVIEAWGFTYKTVGFTWVKQNKVGPGFKWGMGYWTRSNAEICLLATKGSPTRMAKDVEQLVIAPVGAHSAKPSIVQDRIEWLVPGPYLELFARRKCKGWMVWGNDIGSDMLDQTLEAAE